MEGVEDDLSKLISELSSGVVYSDISEKLKLSEHHPPSPKLQSFIDDETNSNAEDVKRVMQATDFDSNYGDSGNGQSMENTPPTLRAIKIPYLHTELSLDALKPVSENSPLHKSATRPISTSQRLPRLSICEDDDSDSSSDDDDSDSDSSSSSGDSLSSSSSNVSLESSLESSESSEQFGSPSTLRRQESLKLEKILQIQEKKRLLKQKLMEQEELELKEQKELMEIKELEKERTASLKLKSISVHQEETIVDSQFFIKPSTSNSNLNISETNTTTTTTTTTTTKSRSTSISQVDPSNSLPPKSRSVSISNANGDANGSGMISKERKKSILASFEEGSPLRSSSRLPSSRGGSIKIKVAKVLEEEMQLQQEFEKQEQLRHSARLSQLIRDLNMSSNLQEEQDQQLRQNNGEEEEDQNDNVSSSSSHSSGSKHDGEDQDDDQPQQQQLRQPPTILLNEPIKSIEEQEQEIERLKIIERMRDQVFSQLDDLEDPLYKTGKPRTFTITTTNSALEPMSMEIPYTKSERVTMVVDDQSASASPQMESTPAPMVNKQFLNIQGRPRKDSISDRWDIGRKEGPRRSMTLNLTRVGEDFSVKKAEAKKINTAMEKILIHISLVDQSHKVICVTEDFLVQDVIVLFAEKLGLIQTEFFSLAEVSDDGYDRWLDPTKLVKEAGIKNLSKLVFKIKYFKQPKRLSDSKAVHLYYLQIQQNVVSGVYPCSEAMSFRLSALQFYITFGAYDKEKHVSGFLDHGSLSEFIPSNFFFELSDDVLQKRLFNLHSQIKCNSNIEAKLRYLDLANKIPTFGVSSFQVYDGIRESSIVRHKRNLCVAEDGILISRKDRAGYDFFPYKEILSYQVTTRGLKIQIPHASVTPNTSDSMSFDTSSYDQSNNIIELMMGYKYFIKHDEFLRGIGSPIEQVDLNISLLLPLFQPPKVRTKSDPLRSRLELFKLNYLGLCQNFHSKPISKLIDQIDIILDKEGSFRNGLAYNSIELPSLNLRGSDLSFIADALKDTLNTLIEEGESIVENLNLLTLDLSNNPLLASDAFEPLKIIMTCSTIIHLNLRNIGLSNKGVMPLVTIIEKYPQIETLQIGKNRVNESGVRVLLRAIKNFNVKIETLGFEETNLTDSGCHIIERLLVNNKTLRNLNISKNKITEQGFKSIFEGIKNNNLHIQDLNISGNPISSKIMTKFIKWLTTADNSIVKLNIASTGLVSSFGSELSKFLISNSCHVKSLDTSYNNLGTSGTKNVIKGIINNHTIDDLSLSANKINSGGCVDLCQSLELDSSVCKKLYLRYCELGAKSLIRIAKMLEVNKTIDTLDLSMNKFSKPSSISIGTMLERNNIIQDLYLTQCHMGNVEIEYILNGIEKNTTVKRLFLDVNPIGKKGIPSLAKLLNENKVLEVLTLRNTNLNGKDILEFIKLLNTNVTIKTINLTENNLEKITPSIKNAINDQFKRLYSVNIQY